MNSFKFQLAIFMLSIIVPMMLNAQFKSQVKEPPTMEEAIKLPGQDDGMDRNLLDSDRFFMNQSYSMSMGFSGGRSTSMALYRNNMTYILSDQLIINAEVGLMHDPLKLDNHPGSRDLSDNLIYGADLLYKPNENTKFKISIDKGPAYNRYNRFGRYSGYRSYDNMRY